MEELYWFTYAVSKGNTNYTGELTADITLNEKVLNADGTLVSDTSKLKKWKPIGDETNKFNGCFYGNGHVIRGIYCDMSSEENVGFFGYIEFDIADIGIEDSYVSGSNAVGGLCGAAGQNSFIECCYFDGTLKGKNFVGGICGYSNGVIANCYADVKFDSTVQPSKDINPLSGTLMYGYDECVNSYYVGNADSTEKRTEQRFENGEIAYLLSQGAYDSDGMCRRTVWICR